MAGPVQTEVSYFERSREATSGMSLVRSEIPSFRSTPCTGELHDYAYMQETLDQPKTLTNS